MPKREPELPPSVRRHGSGFRAIFVPTGSDDGKRERSPTFSTPDAAAQWKADYLTARARGADKPLDLTLSGALQLILDDLDATGGRAGTRLWYRDHARALFAHFGKDRKLHLITRAQLVAFVAKRREVVAASTVVKRDLQVLKRMRRLAADAGYVLPVDPFARLRLPRVRQGRFEFLTTERVDELVTAMRKHRAPLANWHADLAELLFATGIRRQELCSLTVRDVDFAAGRIFVDGKTANRYQTFAKSLEPLLRRLVERASKNGRLVTNGEHAVEYAFLIWKRRLKEPRFSPHCLRHSYGSAMAAHVDPFQLMALMGHTSLTQTSRYYHGRGDVVRAALEALRLGQRTPAPTAPAAVAQPAPTPPAATPPLP